MYRDPKVHDLTGTLCVLGHNMLKTDPESARRERFERRVFIERATSARITATISGRLDARGGPTKSVHESITGP